jgi:capsular polysaccharide export protein
MLSASPLLVIPPFPGARAPGFAEPTPDSVPMDLPAVLSALRKTRVGGSYWGRQTALPSAAFTLDGTKSPIPGSVTWQDDADPWHLLTAATQVRLPVGDSRVLLALAAQRPVVTIDAAGVELVPSHDEVTKLAQRHLGDWQWRSPFNGAPISLAEAIELTGFWRQLIDSNRATVAALGFAYWKRPTVAPLLWNGEKTPFHRGMPVVLPGQPVAVWRSRLSAAQRAGIAAAGAACLEVEDGFIRSTGLGADCVPPLSVIVDPDGVHFDPNRPSALENLLQNHVFSEELRLRAARLRALIVTSGLSKYERGEAASLPRRGGSRRHILVPGQVEDDRAVTSGGALPSNLELLRRARAAAGPDAWLIYKPHPDVLAGHRRGLIADHDLAGLADQVETGAPIADLIAMADELHVNSSLAGFEALLRGKRVTVHGVPFYAGWGLTEDRGPVPGRRTARRSLDELVAATLLLYPRYLDPVTGLPCPAEVLVERLAAPAMATRVTGTAAAVVKARRVQGRVAGNVRRLLAR